MSMLGDRVVAGATGSGSEPAADLPQPVALDPETASALLRIAREAVTAAATRRSATLTGGVGVRPSGVPGSAAPPLPAAAPLSPAVSAALDEPGAAFVTLTEHGSLRGCMGSLVAEQPLGRAVAAAAASAAVRDPRFQPVIVGELPAIHIDVSVLGPAVPLRDPMAFRPGIDGIIVARDGRRALLLPEVATDLGWGAREMLDAVCEKAGLEGHAWHDPHTHLFVFRTVRVSEATEPTEPPAGC
jgi:AmmeMemoRadiSam system protein A